MMNRRILRWGVVGALWTLTVVIAFKIGIHLGTEALLNADSSAKASLLTYELRYLRSGKTARIIQAKEIELDGQVVRAIDSQRSWSWLFWPFDNWEHDHYLRKVAEYRQIHPPVVVATEPPDGPSKYDVNPFAADVKRSTETLIKQYGK